MAVPIPIPVPNLDRCIGTCLCFVISEVGTLFQNVLRSNQCTTGVADILLRCCSGTSSENRNSSNDGRKAEEEDAAASKQGAVFLHAGRLVIEHSDNPKHWKKYPGFGSRYPELAEVLEVYFLCIEGNITLNTDTFKHEDGTLLVDDKYYAAYLLFKTTDNSSGLDSIMEAKITKDDRQTTLSRNRVCLYQAGQQTGADVKCPQSRPEAGGWMEVELGRFYYGYSSRNDELNVMLRHQNDRMITGLIVGGMELRSVTGTA